MKRYVALWFPHLTTDRRVIRRPELRGRPFVLTALERGHMVIQSASIEAQEKGIMTGMALADARALYPALQVLDDQPHLAEKLLKALAEWCIRYTPVVAIDFPDGLVLDASGCAHLWGGEHSYLKDINTRLEGGGYHVRAAMADTIGTAWAVARYGQSSPVIGPGLQKEALLPLPPAALRLESEVVERMHKLGLSKIERFIHMPRQVLRRRFGQQLLIRLDEALGEAIESIEPLCLVEPYQERLVCLEPIRTKTGIEIALEKLLEKLCGRLQHEIKGLREAVFTCYCMDGKKQRITIGTNHAVRNAAHLFKLFELKIAGIAPGWGIELFMLEAPVVEDLPAQQERLWTEAGSCGNSALACLLDRMAARIGQQAIHRYLPDEHYWPERSLRPAASMGEEPAIDWPEEQIRPICLLPVPERIVVSAPIPDYPPMLFIYQGKIHQVRQADGPERIEREWWIEEGLQRDYYRVEDEEGARYWLFRSGHYDGHHPEWFIHGYFA